MLKASLPEDPRLNLLMNTPLTVYVQYVVKHNKKQND